MFTSLHNLVKSKMSFLTKTLHLTRLKALQQTITRALNTNITKASTPLIVTLNSNYYASKENPWIYKQQDIIKNPNFNINPVKFPNGLFWVPKIEKESPEVIEAPTVDNGIEEKQAARLIVIRRKKMKKHKLRKLRKRMKFEWAKIRQRRELKKEKEFQAVLIKQCKDAELFSAEKYVEERLNKLNEFIIPKTYKGRRLPEFLIREKLGLPPKQ